MRKKCGEAGCDAPKSLCRELLSPEYNECPHWNSIALNAEDKVGKSNEENKIIPWSGMELTPDEITLLSHRTTPLIIGIIGAANAGKTSFLGMLYTLLFNGRKFAEWKFAGSYTLIAWEAQAKGLKIGSNGQVAFPKATPSAPDYYSMYHMALKKNQQLYDVLFADSSGEVFTKWASDVSDTEAENAQWIYQNSDVFIFFVDCEALIQGRGRVKNSISQLAGQVAAELGERRIVIVWSKADKIEEIRPNIREATEEVLKENFPNAPTFFISNFSRSADDELCYINNLAATETALNGLIYQDIFIMTPKVGPSADFFFNYRGKI